MKTGTNSAIAVLLAAFVAVCAFAQAPAPVQNFEAVPPPALRLESPELDKTAVKEPQETKGPTVADVAGTSANGPITKEQFQAIQQEVAAGSETTTLESADEQPANTNAAQTPNTGTSLMKSVAALCFVLFLILALYYLLNRYGKKSPLFAGTSLGTILGRVYLSPKAELHFVRVKDRVLVVGVTANEVSRVAEFDAAMFEESQPAEVPAHVDLPPPQISTFAKELRAISAPEATQLAVSDEIASLRAELDKARQYFRETSGESGAL
ncbi:MAG: FliO/MopB family protein [Candidatus Hydrogenedentes bacterium]|nr:FliO/MopB family protein [Candidatus Hydrogenedentota bacterium]